MNYALGFRVKSGRAVSIALTGSSTAPEALMRALVPLSDPAIGESTQPYHSGFGAAQEDPAVITRLIAIVQRCARQSVAALLNDARISGASCRGAALVVGSVIDPEAVGNLHIRAHAYEGRLFRTALEEALQANHVRCTIVVEKVLAAETAKKLNRADGDVQRIVAGFGRALGGPWRAEEKAAARAAWMLL